MTQYTDPKQAVIVQIVPHRTALPDGIGDYAVLLAERLRTYHGIESDFLSGTPEAVDPAAEDLWPTVFVTARTKASLVDALERAESLRPHLAIVVHAGGYGYAKRGAPLWLLAGLKEWRRRKPALRIVSVFHELFATGPLWRSSFWLGPLQAYIAHRIWDLSDCGLTTNGKYFRELSAWSSYQGKRLELMPVPSNVGEPEAVPAFSARPPRAVVFGRPGVEAVVYQNHLDDLAKAVEIYGIEEIIDVGMRNSAPPTRIRGVPVRAVGRLTAADISRALLDCRFGFLANDIARLGKSGIFAAYAAHGVIPVRLGSNETSSADVLAGRHFLQAPFGVGDLKAADTIQTNIGLWYRGHDSVRLAACVASLVCSCQSSSGDATR